MKLTIKETVHEKTTPEEIIALILNNRGIGKSNKEDFLHPQNPSNYTLKDVGINGKDFDKAFIRLQKAHKEREKVVVYADYDVDGITGGTILWTTLHELGFNVSPHVSYRGTEGYGFSTQSVERLKKDFSPKIIMTVDHGITGEPFIKALNKEGIDVIVLDHHLAVHGLPKSVYALLYTRVLCGSGVSYFVSREIAKKFPSNEKLKSYFEIDFPVLAGIGTIADIVPLIGPSRALASFALKNISKTTLVGFQSLLKRTGLAEKNSHTSYDVGFIIGPRINAAGRMGDALDSLRLLCTTDAVRANNLLGKIETYNKDRQKQVIDHLKLAEKIAENQSESKILFIASEKFEEGTVGLLAAKLTEKYYRPTLVGVIKKGIIKGSARS
ncbi:MAG: DHH family phosphoesterase, partial [Patescibacteria group bacterium]